MSVTYPSRGDSARFWCRLGTVVTPDAHSFVVARAPIGSRDHEDFADKILARTSSAWRVELTHEAALVLRQQLDEALDVAETQCRRDGCTSIGLHDGLCAVDHEAADIRRAV